jgi:hypothetical protein
MALTSTEEAQTRQLLDQLSSLLSLASSEPTIISKLAATKASLSDLASVSSVNDTDILLSRQGTDDKSVTIEKIKDHIKASVSTVAFNDGTAAEPSITNNGDLNTGAYFPNANVFAITTDGTERVRFTNTGVGVNVATPLSAFDVASALPPAASNGYRFRDISDSTKYISLERTESNYSYNGISGESGLLYSTTSLAIMADTIGGNNSIFFVVGGAIRAELQHDGRFGIGTTSPATTLDVNGDVTITDKIIHSGDTDTSIRFPALDTVSVETAGSERFRIGSTGNIGVGTTAPATKLHVSTSYTAPTGGIDPGIQAVLSNTSGFAGLQLLSGNAQAAYIHLGDTDDADRGAIIYDHATDNLLFHTAGAQRMRVSSSGLLLGAAELATPGGTAPLFAVRAWVNFNGTGIVAIRASGNVSSVTDNGTGDYTINFATALPDANYAFSGSCGTPNGSSIVAGDNNVVSGAAITGTGLKTASQCRVVTLEPSISAEDAPSVSIIFVR